MLVLISLVLESLTGLQRYGVLIYWKRFVVENVSNGLKFFDLVSALAKFVCNPRLELLKKSVICPRPHHKLCHEL